MSEMIQAMCSKCKNNFMMDKELYNHRKKHGSRINCPTCLEASKENKYKKASETHKKNWANYNEEDRIKRVNNAKAGIHNMSPEAKAKRSKNSSIATKIVMNSLNEQQKKVRSIKLSKANKRRYDRMKYDDNLTDNTPVLHINTNETMTFKSFMAILNWLNLSNKNKKEIINMTCDYKFPEIYNHIIAESSTTIGQLCV